MKDYLIGASVEIKAYVDSDSCCDGWKDYTECNGKATCKSKLHKLIDKGGNHYSKKLLVTGSRYEVSRSYSGNKRRKLLQESTGVC